MENYLIQDWVFNKAYGKYSSDLAESGVECQSLSSLNLSSNMELDYSRDKGLGSLVDEINCMYAVSEKSNADCLVTHGAQEAVYLMLRCLLNKDHKVLTVVPGWQQLWSVPEEIGCDVSKIRVQSASDVDHLIQRIDSSVKLVILNFPSNPTGIVPSEEQKSWLIQSAKEHNVWLLIDEEYLYDFQSSYVHEYEKTVSISSLSKVFGYPSLRIGWAVGPSQLIQQMVNYKRYTTISNSMLLEKYAVSVLRNREQHISRYLDFIEQGRYLLEEFAGLSSDHLEYVKPKGTPFAWFNLINNKNSMQFSEKLLERYGLLTMPAEVFGSSSGLRIPFARRKSLLVKGFNIILEELGVQQRLTHQETTLVEKE